MEKIYTTPEEITEDFIKRGWGKDTTFTEVTFAEVRFTHYGIVNGMCNGHKYFKMNVSGNIYDETGKLVFLNIPCVKQA